MTIKKILLSCVIAFLYAASGFSQDLIIRKDGGKIHCKLLDQDSTLFYYTIGEDKVLYNVKKEEVQNYYLASQESVQPPKTSEPVKKPLKPSISDPVAQEIMLLNFTTGIGIPTGIFASKTTAAEAGLATTGYLVQLSIIFKPVKFFGISAAYRNQGYFVDDAVLGKQLTAANPGLTFDINSGNWIARGFYGGLYFTHTDKELTKLSFHTSVSVGYPQFVSPDLTVSATQGGRSAGTLKQDAGTTRSVAVITGIGMNYQLSKYVAFHLNADYFSAGEISFAQVKTTAPNGSYNYTDFSQKISSLNFTIGLSFLVF